MKKTQDTRTLDGFILDELSSDIEHAMARCRPLICGPNEPNLEYCYQNLVSALQYTMDEINRRAELCI